MTRPRPMTHRLAAAALAPVLFLTGCSSPQKDQEAFSQITDEIFYDTVTSDGLTLHSTLTDPAAYGITEFPATLGSYDRETSDANYEDMMETLEALRKIKKKNLTAEQQTDYEILLNMLEKEENTEDFYLYGYPLSSVNGLQTQLPFLFADYLFTEEQDVEHYLLLLADIDEYYEQVLAFVQEQTDAGIYLSDLTIDGIIDSCQMFLDSPEDGILAETFADRLEELGGLTEEQRDSYIARNREILEQDFTNAYVLLTEGLEQLKGNLDEPVGLCELPFGKAYYEYLLDTSIYTSYDRPKTLYRAIALRLQDDMLDIYDALTEDPNLYDALDELTFAIEDPEEALTDLQTKILADFPETSGYAYTLKTIPEALVDYSSPAFYLIPTIDRQDQNVIYVSPALPDGITDIYPTMAHEGFPGHLYQCNYFNSVNDSRLRAVLNFTSYAEGWATYVEYQSYAWDDNCSEELGQILSANASVNLALSAMVDYQVNYEGMTVDELNEYLTDSFGISDEETARNLYQYVCENPANYMKYYVGYLEFAEMREEAEKELGDAFSAKEFHTFLLEFGPAPFDVIRDHFGEWLAAQQS